VVVSCEPGQQDNDFWILLDGRWQVEHDGQSYPSGHADAGEWFSTSDAHGDCRLVVTEHSYVMKITRADMNDMLSRGFAFDAHLQQGHAYYRTLFAATTSSEHAASVLPVTSMLPLASAPAATMLTSWPTDAVLQTAVLDDAVELLLLVPNDTLMPILPRFFGSPIAS